MYDVYVETLGLVGVVYSYIAVFEENGKVQSVDKYLYTHKYSIQNTLNRVLFWEQTGLALVSWTGFGTLTDPYS